MQRFTRVVLPTIMRATPAGTPVISIELMVTAISHWPGVTPAVCAVAGPASAMQVRDAASWVEIFMVCLLAGGRPRGPRHLLHQPNVMPTRPPLDPFTDE